MKYIVLLVFLASIFSCRKEIDLKIKNKEDVPVLNYFISNSKNTSPSIYITKSNFILNSNQKFEGLTNAKINFFISDVLTGFIPSKYDTVNILPGNYLLYEDTINYANLVLQANKKYNMQISVPGFKELTTETYIPSETKFTLSSLRYDSGFFEFKVLIQDDDPAFNYYLFYVTSEFKNPLDSNQIQFNGGYYIPNEVKKVRGTPKSNGILDLFANAANFDFVVSENEIQNFNHTITFTNKIALDPGIPYYPGFSKFDNLTIYKLSDDAYKYMKSVRQQQITGDNPFSEPVFIYSNVKNGLGIFAGYSISNYK